MTFTTLMGFLLIFTAILIIVLEAVIPAFGFFGLIGIAIFSAGIAVIFEMATLSDLYLTPGIVIGSSLFSALFLALAILFTRRVYKREVTTGLESMIDKKAIIIEWNGKQGRVRAQGEDWKATSSQKLSLKKDDIVYIEGHEDLTLHIASNPTSKKET